MRKIILITGVVLITFSFAQRFYFVASFFGGYKEFTLSVYVHLILGIILVIYSFFIKKK